MGTKGRGKAMNAKVVFGVALASAVVAPPALAADDTEISIASFFGLSALSGKTTLGTDGAKLESWLIAGQLITIAGGKIAADIPAGTSKILLATDDQKIDFAAFSQASARLASLETSAARARFAKCPKGNKGAGNFSPMSAPIDFATLPAAIVGAADSTVDVTGITLNPSERALLNAIANRLPDKAILLDGAAPTKSELANRWTKLVSQAAASKVGNCAEADHVKSFIAEVDAAKPDLTGSSDKVPASLLERAIQFEPLSGDGLHILRVRIEQAGATVVNTKNALTSLGIMPALRIRGGLVVSYRLSEASSGLAKKGGVVVCSVPGSTLASVGSKPISETSCK
jgi:hypothetical protein